MVTERPSAADLSAAKITSKLFMDSLSEVSGKGGYLGITVENGNAQAEWYASAQKGAQLTVQHTQNLGE
jgi:hypothetical protein